MKLYQFSADIDQYYSKYRNKQNKFNVITVGKEEFEIDDKYEILKSIGQGCFNVVLAAKNKNLNNINEERVAIKKIKAFEHKLYALRNLRELRVLRLLKHENIIGIHTIMLPKSREEFKDIYIVQDLMETNFYQIIKSDQILTNEHHQFFLYQLLRGLKYLHSANVLHRNLKPQNLLVNSNCELKICGFGYARALIPSQKLRKLTDYVTTRWYRAPELLLQCHDYNQSIDIWSVGCIFAELLNRKPFAAGFDTRNQIELILEKIGTPSQQNFISKENYQMITKGLPIYKKKDFKELFPTASDSAIDLLRKFLQFDPSKRITVEQALQHPYLSVLHCQDDEPISEPVQSVDFEFEDYDQLTLKQLQDCIYEEILIYHFKDFKDDYETKKKHSLSIMQHILNKENQKIMNFQTDCDTQFDDE